MGRKRKSFSFYKPKFWLVVIDIVLILANISFVFLFLPLTTPEPFSKYAIPLLVFLAIWLFASYFLKRYKRLRARSFFQQVFSLFYTSLIVFAVLGGFILIQPKSPYSENVLLTVLIGVFISEYLVLFVYFAYRYATQYELPEFRGGEREAAVAAPSDALSQDALSERKERIIENTGLKVFNFIDRETNWSKTGTLILTDVKLPELSKIEFYKFGTIIQLKRLNNTRGINKMFTLINDKLPNDGVFVCCFKSQKDVKQLLLKRKPKMLSRVRYAGHFIIHSVFPHFFLTKRLYYDFTEGKRRILSKTEILGRLNYCGFEIKKEVKIDNLHYVVAVRNRNSIIESPRNYGLLIKLKRMGKDGKLFNVYKIRTMYPYAEFLQSYVYEKNDLAEGGKFQNDMRITTVGSFLRKFWIDEFPMFFNLLKGDMKLVGVRPLSQHYFNLYSTELQQKRIQFRPGLLPPFYADMPKTLEEIQASEMKYLVECEKMGVFRTDVRYFFLILKSIFIKKARSA